MAETEAAEPARKRPRRPRKTKAVEVAETHAGPTDFSDPLMREEIKRAGVWIGMAVLVGLAIYLAEPLLVIFGGMVFAAMIDGGARLLGRVLPVPRGIRVALVVLGAVGFLAWVALSAGSQIADQAAELPGTIEAQAMKGLHWLQAHGARIDAKAVEGIAEKLLGGVGQLTSAVGGVLGGMTTVFLIVVMGIYFAAEPQLYRRGFAWMLPLAEREHFHGTANEMGRTLRMLMFGRLLGMGIEGVVTFLALLAGGVPMAGLLGTLTGLLAFLPNIGAPISGALMVLVGFSVSPGVGLYCIAVYIAVHTIDGNIVVPIVAKRTADLAPALVLGAQLIMGALFGLIGLALADPLVAMIKVALERRSIRNEADAHQA